jgi:hypothetical protein
MAYETGSTLAGRIAMMGALTDQDCNVPPQRNRVRLQKVMEDRHKGHKSKSRHKRSRKSCRRGESRPKKKSWRDATNQTGFRSWTGSKAKSLRSDGSSSNGSDTKRFGREGYEAKRFKRRGSEARHSGRGVSSCTRSKPTHKGSTSKRSGARRCRSPRDLRSSRGDGGSWGDTRLQDEVKDHKRCLDQLRREAQLRETQIKLDFTRRERSLRDAADARERQLVDGADKREKTLRDDAEKRVQHLEEAVNEAKRLVKKRDERMLYLEKQAHASFAVYKKSLIKSEVYIDTKKERWTGVRAKPGTPCAKKSAPLKPPASLAKKGCDQSATK